MILRVGNEMSSNSAKIWPLGPKFCHRLLAVAVASIAVASVAAFRLPSSRRHSSLPRQALSWHQPQPRFSAIISRGEKTTHTRIGGISSSSMIRMYSSKKEKAPTPFPPLRMSSSSEQSITRGRALTVSISAWIAGLTLATEWSNALDPVKQTQELLRIWRQEEFDNNALGGGELASPEGGKTIQPVLALIPIVTLRLQLGEVENFLKDPRTFGDALAILRTQDFQKKDIKRAFNLYSDNIYYLSGSERENKYLQGGATPSSRQTLQYLLRNDIIDNVEALAAEIAFLIREREAAADGGSASAADLDEADLRVYLAKCKASFDKYLGMVYQNEIDEATDYAKMALAARS